jgi:hypothetical protein
MQTRMRFNFRSKFDYDKEAVTNQVFQFEFKKDFIRELQKVKFPRKVFIRFTCLQECELDVVAQLSVQPEAPDDIKNRLSKKVARIDYDALRALDEELDQYYQHNLAFYKHHKNLGDVDFVDQNVKLAEMYPSLSQRIQFLQYQNEVKSRKTQDSKDFKVQAEQDFIHKSASDLSRWDRYRAAREEFIDHAVFLIKRKKLVQVLLAKITLASIMKTMTSNLWVRHE